MQIFAYLKNSIIATKGCRKIEFHCTVLREIIISFGVVIAVLLLMLVAYRDPENLWIRVFCGIIISIILMVGTYQCYTIIKLRNSAKELLVCHQITIDGNLHYPRRKALYIRQQDDGTYSLYNKGSQLLVDSICFIGVHHVGVNNQDTFDLIKYISPDGDTLLYDAYLGKSIMPEQFEPHYEEATYWEFNYSNL